MTEIVMQALQLLLIGMLTVFTVLTLVVFTGRMLVIAVNRFSKDKEALPATSKSIKERAKISSRRMAAITGAVSIVTNGKGIVLAVKKLK